MVHLWTKPNLSLHPNKQNDFYPTLNKKRNEFFKTQYAESKKFVEQAEKEHKLGQQLITALKSNKIAEVKAMLCERNKGAEATLSRTVILMDVTGSMDHLLQKAKNAVTTMFERIAIVLKGPNSFEMQFVVYRNYNAPADMLLQTSPWESKPKNLRTFMETVEPEYGWGNEAIEVGLAHVNREHEKATISQVILIGDAPANTKEEVTQKRGNSSHKAPFPPISLKTTLFSTPTYYEDELNILKDKKINVHAFFVDMRAKQNFEEIARASNGRCEKLEINSEKGSDQLTNLEEQKGTHLLTLIEQNFPSLILCDIVLLCLWDSKFVQVVMQESIFPFLKNIGCNVSVVYKTLRQNTFQ
ncbi:hypothetical protein RFI_03865 [Reticulomyxa filosa]|uniref:VWFA domain-containing protein n=1 Tax=Reticulomyxa filosa TaxID=46433 RepID=X6P581_RETFI|nr:hypothetical protein RFI_03865 [Reticulomyxa filosa]|eukprot:ETO33244.1 hypothetical protein RFI_03865 [Reticulomyxa filosa]